MTCHVSQLAFDAGLGLAPDPADPAPRIRRIRADIETAGPDPGARTPKIVQKHPRNAQKRPKIRRIRPHDQTAGPDPDAIAIATQFPIRALGVRERWNLR